MKIAFQGERATDAIHSRKLISGKPERKKQNEQGKLSPVLPSFQLVLFVCHRLADAAGL
jgi:hypothetical protein